ncbi:putative E3 ubiquitin-protein ligase HERC4 [Symbiodinium microadriaticum]|uniref:HECT-type E3 ubiquitin transferase n=1 Tax=Symbiodinium microadriaticum TaxID=2951 RepID=A0A1Q9F2Q5_SYMMI|nr:putative E3 ubiquitin-protein ligase HERC4 [Symbiodinium microadriaticum]
MIRDARRTEQWRETTRALCATLRCPSVLNSSFHFQGSPRPFLDSEVLHTALELLMDAAPVEVHDAVPREQLRSILIYLMLPQLRNTKFVQRRRHAIMSKLVLHLAFTKPADRRLLMDLIVDEMPQAFILKKAVVPAVRLFLNERVRMCCARGALDDPGLWHGTLAMQLLFLANEKLRENQRSELDVFGSDDQALRSRFLGPEEFQISVLDDSTIPPHVALEQLIQVSTMGMGMLAPSAKLLPPPSELVFGKDTVADAKTTWLPQSCCVLLMHRNLVSMAFKQKVLQVSNAISQQRLQEQAAGPHHILALLAGQAIRPYFIMEVSRDKIVEDVARILRSAEAAALHLPLKVKFAGEDGQDEGGVRREFFQVLIRRLFDESYSMFTHDPDSHATWFSETVLETEDTDELFKVCGTVIGLAVYNNEHGIEIHFPLAMFKKLKGEELGLADLQDIKPKVWMSLEQLLSWQPTTADPNKEFEDTFCLTFSANYDYFGIFTGKDIVASTEKPDLTLDLTFIETFQAVLDENSLRWTSWTVYVQLVLEASSWIWVLDSGAAIQDYLDLEEVDSFDCSLVASWLQVAVLLLLGMTVLHWLCKHCWPADASALSDAYNQKLQTLMERSLPAQDLAPPSFMAKLKVHKAFWAMVLDMALDVNAIVVFATSHHPWFAVLASIIVCRALWQQLVDGGLWTLWTDYCESLSRGRLTDRFHAVVFPEKSLEAPGSLLLQYYTFEYVGIEDSWALWTFAASMLLSICNVADAAYSMIVLNTMALLETAESDNPEMGAKLETVASDKADCNQKLVSVDP